MLPNIDITFSNGALGQVQPLADGCMGLVIQADEVGATLEHNTAYTVKSMQDVAALGIVDSVGNHRLYKFLSEFFEEGGTGQKLWLMTFPKMDSTQTPAPIKLSTLFIADGAGVNPVKQLLDAAQGEIRGLFAVFNPAPSYTPVIANGIDEDVMLVASKAQILLEDYTDTKKAPAFCVTEAYAFTGIHTALANLSTHTYNRVSVMLGDSENFSGVTTSKGAALGCLAGRLARLQVHENAGKVREGALKPLTMFIKDTPVEQYDVESIHDKGFITLRTFVGRSGYYISDDHQATLPSDDYRHITHRRTIDKAYRLAYGVLVDFILDDLQLTNSGTVAPIWAKTVETQVISAIYNQMTTIGELSVDEAVASDRGVRCQVSTTNNVAATSRVEVIVQVRPKGHARYIDVPLGFIPVTQ